MFEQKSKKINKQIDSPEINIKYKLYRNKMK